MTIRDKSTGKTIGHIVTNRSMTIGEAMTLIGYPWTTNETTDESGYCVDGVYYGEDDLEMDYEEVSKS